MAKLAIHLLGQLQVVLDEKTVNDFSTNKARALLAYLVVESDRVHARQSLAGLLWPESSEKAAKTSLRSALTNLRHALSDRNSAQPFLIITRHSVQLNPDGDIWVDATEFGQCLSDYSRHSSDVDKLESGVALYGGDFLAGFSLPDALAFEEWALVHREGYQLQMMEALFQLASWYEAAADYPKAIKYAWRQVEQDAWQERGQRQLIRLLTLSGRRAAALAQYQAFRKVLLEKLGAEPSRETRVLYERIRDETMATS